MIDVDSSSPKNSGALTPLWFCGSSVGSAQCTSLNHFHTLRLSSTPTVAPWDSQTCCNTLHRHKRGLPGTAEGVVGLVLGVAAATTSSGDKGPGQLFCFTLGPFSSWQGGKGVQAGGHPTPKPQ